MMQRLRGRYAHGKRSVVDTYNSAKVVFEKHNVVLTIGASIASAGAAWAGYSARQIHQKKVEDRLNSLEHVMATVHNLEEEQVKALTRNVGVSYNAFAATAGTTLIIGCGLGFRGGRWYTLRRHQKQQQRLLQAVTTPSPHAPKPNWNSSSPGPAKANETKGGVSKTEGPHAPKPNLNPSSPGPAKANEIKGGVSKTEGSPTSSDSKPSGPPS